MPITDITGQTNQNLNQNQITQTGIAALNSVQPTASVVQPQVAPLSQMQTDYQSYFNTAKPGSYTDFAGGVLYRAPDDMTAVDYLGNHPAQNRAIFFSPTGEEYTLRPETNIADIANTIPEIAKAWQQQYGYTATGEKPTTILGDWNPIGQDYADASRDRYATNRGMLFDPQLRSVNLSGYQNNPQGAWEKLAQDVYGGRGMTMQDISRLEDAVGAVGKYYRGDDGLYYVDPNSPFSKANVPESGYTYDDLVRMQSATTTSPLQHQATPSTTDAKSIQSATPSAAENVLSSLKFDTDPEKSTPEEIRTNIGGLLAAQNKYGITDAQLAAASNGKYTETGIAQLLNPVRNVQKNLTDLSSDATKSGAEVRSGINSLMSNKYVNALYGDALASTVAAANKSYSGEYGNKKFADLNPLSVNNVLSQLKAERDAAAQSGTKLINGGAAGSKNGGFGSEDAVLEDMAKNLVASGITDIRQVGQGPVTEKQDVVERYTYNGSPVREVENDYGGGKSYYTLIGDGESAEWKAIPKDQLTLSKGYIHHYSLWNPDGGSSGEFVPLTADELKTVKDGKATVPTGQTAIINKQTGQPLRTNYSERTGGNMWSGTFAGDGNTGYGVQFNKDGTPIFYTQGASSSDLGSVAPLLAMASFIPGVAPFAMAANAAIAASQGNWLAALASGIGALPGVSNAIGGAGTIGADTAATLGTTSKVLNLANAANQKNWAGILAGAANLGNVGNTQIGDTGLTVGQGLKGLGVLGALNRGDYLSAGLGGASLAGVNTVPGTDVSLNNAMNAVNIARAAQALDKTGNSVPLINAVGQTVTKAKGGLLEGVTPDKVRASARNVDPAYFRGIASNLMRTA